MNRAEELREAGLKAIDYDEGSFQMLNSISSSLIQLNKNLEKFVKDKENTQ